MGAFKHLFTGIWLNGRAGGAFAKREPQRVSRLNWKGRLHNAAIAAGTQALSPLRRSFVSMDRPVFIWGNGQSGSFLLYDLLAAFGGFAFHTIQGARKKGLAARSIGPYVFPNGYPHEGLRRFWSGCGLPFEGRDGWTFRSVLTDADDLKVDAYKIRSNYERAATSWRWQSQEPVRILDKCPHYIFMTAAIERIFPDALHIFCVRDKDSVVESIARRFHQPNYEAGWQGYPSGWYGNIMLPGHERLQSASVEARHLWQTEQVLSIGYQAARQLGPRCLISHHEDLLRDPETQLKNIARFIGATVPYDMPAILAAGVVRARTAEPAEAVRARRSASA